MSDRPKTPQWDEAEFERNRRAVRAAMSERATELERERDEWKERANFADAYKYRERAERAETALLEARRRLRVNSIAWHTQFHSGDWETCEDSSCTNDHEVLGSLGPEWRPQEVARREDRDERVG